MSLLRAGAVVSGLALAGRALGFARTVLVAAWLGAGPAADAFFLAFRLFAVLRAPLAAGGVQGAFVPLFARRLERGDAARRFAGEAFGLALATLGAGTALAALALPWLAPGLAGDGLAVTLARIMLPSVALAAPALLLAGVLNALGRFAAAAALPAVFNLVLAAALVALSPVLATPAHALAWGVVAAGAAQLAWLGLACRRAGFRPAIAWPRPSPALRRFARRVAPAAIGAGAVQAMVLLDLGLASALKPGAVSVLHYAERVVQLLPGIVGAAAAVVVLPALSRRGADRAWTLNRTLEAVALLAFPGAVALAVLAAPAAAALFQRGAFGAGDAAATATAIAAYAAGLPAWAAIRTLAAAAFAGGDTVTPMAAVLGALAVNLAASLALMGPLGHAGIALGTALACWLQAAALAGVLVRKGAFAPDRRLGVRAARAAGAALAMGAVLWFAVGAAGEAGGGVGGAMALAALVALGLAAYALFALLAGALRPGELARAWRR